MWYMTIMGDLSLGRKILLHSKFDIKLFQPNSISNFNFIALLESFDEIAEEFPRLNPAEKTAALSKSFSDR